MELPVIILLSEKDSLLVVSLANIELFFELDKRKMLFLYLQ
jgi:hypothetical protein